MQFPKLPKLVKPIYAQCVPGKDGLSLEECLRLKDGSKVSDTYTDFGTVVNLIVDNLMVLAGVFLFIAVIASGFGFLASGKSKGKDQSMTVAKNAIVGFLIMFSAYWIVQIIEKITGADIRL